MLEGKMSQIDAIVAIIREKSSFSSYKKPSKNLMTSRMSPIKRNARGTSTPITIEGIYKDQNLINNFERNNNSVDSIDFDPNIKHKNRTRILEKRIEEFKKLEKKYHQSQISRLEEIKSKATANNMKATEISFLMLLENQKTKVVFDSKIEFIHKKRIRITEEQRKKISKIIDQKSKQSKLSKKLYRLEKLNEQQLRTNLKKKSRVSKLKQFTYNIIDPLVQQFNHKQPLYSLQDFYKNQI